MLFNSLLLLEKYFLHIIYMIFIQVLLIDVQNYYTAK